MHNICNKISTKIAISKIQWLFIKTNVTSCLSLEIKIQSNSNMHTPWSSTRATRRIQICCSFGVKQQSLTHSLTYYWRFWQSFSDPWFTFSQRILNYLAIQSFDFEHTGSRIFLKRIVRTKLVIYVYHAICNHYLAYNDLKSVRL
jgi:hypothetical protein